MQAVQNNHRKWFIYRNFQFTYLIHLKLLLAIFLLAVGIYKTLENYTQLALCQSYNNNSLLSFPVSFDYSGKVLLVYSLSNFRQSDRAFQLSKSIKQFQGKSISLQESKNDCYPYFYNQNFTDKLTPDKIAYPCGNAARLVFNDTFQLMANGKTIPNSREILPQSYLQIFNISTKETSWLNVDKHAFAQWMRTASLQGFIKTISIHQVLIKKGDLLQLRITDNYKTLGGKITKTVCILSPGLTTYTNFFMIGLVAGCLLFLQWAAKLLSSSHYDSLIVEIDLQ